MKISFSLLVSKSVLILAILSVAQIGFAHGGEDHSKHSKAKAHAGHDSEGKQSLVKGKLIGLTCFLKHGGTGKSHKSCAKQCAEKGLPIGLKSDDGKVYIVGGKGHDSLVETYKPLLKYMEENVTVKGAIFEKEGQRMIVIDKIKKG